jgi:hypothetical protein
MPVLSPGFGECRAHIHRKADRRASDGEDNIAGKHASLRRHALRIDLHHDDALYAPIRLAGGR